MLHWTRDSLRNWWIAPTADAMFSDQKGGEDTSGSNKRLSGKFLQEHQCNIKVIPLQGGQQGEWRSRWRLLCGVECVTGLPKAAVSSRLWGLLWIGCCDCNDPEWEGKSNDYLGSYHEWSPGVYVLNVLCGIGHRWVLPCATVSHVEIAPQNGVDMSMAHYDAYVDKVLHTGSLLVSWHLWMSLVSGRCLLQAYVIHELKIKVRLQGSTDLFTEQPVSLEDVCA